VEGDNCENVLELLGGYKGTSPNSMQCVLYRVGAEYVCLLVLVISWGGRLVVRG
jgi:hypothetical protein